MYASTFLMRDGRIANLDAHLARLRDETSISTSAIEDIREKLRQAGQGVFRPVVQVVGSTVSIDLHPTVLPPDEAIIDAEGIRDERRQPTRRGPDLGWQMSKLQQIRRRGANGGLLIDDRGFVISGIFSAILCLDHSQAHISAHPRASSSVTMDATLEIFEQQGIEPVEHPDGMSMAMLRSTETWLLSSLEGVRKITGWMEYGSVLNPSQGGVPRLGAPTHREINDLLWQAAEYV
ncbi:aminotransferase class IV [Corynebacterium alimapuense]|uniref:aminotransferase class IV n=1 Tax=Corynebacterium alimapuense TaxID=1576874 RepID=UPI00140220AB|nr:aminotransferase class IV [Corynebacterium alimapuense]